MDHIERLIESSELREICELVKKASPVREVELGVRFTDQAATKERLIEYKLLVDRGHTVKNPNWGTNWDDGKKKMESVIYIIEGIGINTLDSKIDTYRQFWEYKRNGQRACARLNSPCRLNSSTSEFIMYVGSSTGGRIETRLKPHIGNVNPGTYAGTSGLHLKYWFTGECKITIKEYNVLGDVLRCYSDIDKLKQTWESRYNGEYKLSRDVLQLMEDDLADELKPVFGKVGGNNRKSKPKNQSQKNPKSKP